MSKTSPTRPRGPSAALSISKSSTRDELQAVHQTVVSTLRPFVKRRSAESDGEFNFRVHAYAALLVRMVQLNLNSLVDIQKVLNGLVMANVVPSSALPAIGTFRFASGDILEKTFGHRASTKSTLLPSFFWALFNDTNISADQLTRLVDALRDLMDGRVPNPYPNSPPLLSQDVRDSRPGDRCPSGSKCLITADMWIQFAAELAKQEIDPSTVGLLVHVINLVSLSKGDVLNLLALVSRAVANVPGAQQELDTAMTTLRQRAQSSAWRRGNLIREKSIDLKHERVGTLLLLARALAKMSPREQAAFISMFDQLTRGLSPDRRTVERQRRARRRQSSQRSRAPSSATVTKR